MLENSWNTSVRVLFNLPLNTQIFFIQPGSEKHLKNIYEFLVTKKEVIKDKNSSYLEYLWSVLYTKQVKQTVDIPKNYLGASQL